MLVCLIGCTAVCLYEAQFMESEMSTHAIEVNPRLVKHSVSTIRTWLLLAIIQLGTKSPIRVSAKALAEKSKAITPLSRRSIGKAIRELEALGMIRIDKSDGARALIVEGIDCA